MLTKTYGTKSSHCLHKKLRARACWTGLPQIFKRPPRFARILALCWDRTSIEGPLGVGGMGEVFRAVDTRLGRQVAIKISDQRFISGRFEREARAIAALNHPHICALYDVGPDYLVMELVEGSTWAERIALGPIPFAEALAIAHQIRECAGKRRTKKV